MKRLEDCHECPPSPDRVRRRGGSTALTVLVAWQFLVQAAPAKAACNVIPAAAQPFRSASGSVDRPFAAPDDWVEIGPDGCAQTSGIPDDVDALQITVAVRPAAS